MARTAIVTGGSGALGQAVTLRLLQDGLAVSVPWIIDKERDRLEARLPADARSRVLIEKCDVLDPDAFAALVGKTEQALEPPSVLVTVVGGFAGGALVETDLATWEGQMRLNLTSAFVATRAVVPGMLARGHGRVVTIASRAVVPPAAGFIAYTVSKAGVIALTRALAEETRGRGVTVNAVLPSTMDTEANRAGMPGADFSTWTPVERVAEAIAFLARPEASHVTGSLVAV
jgi:NAD(P)-dependent dehydrogenase (short-subunit alcohol dehydrogenase family)